MEWFYEKAGKQNGPVEVADLLRMLKGGDLDLKALVWREGMADWKPMAEAGVLKNESGVELVVCAYSGEVRAKTEMVPYGTRWVLPEHREAFVQNLMEGATIQGSDDVSDYEPKMGRYLRQSWDLLFEDLWPAVGASAVIVIAYIAASQLPFGGLLANPLFAGLSYYMILKVRGQSARFEDSFSGFPRNFWQLLLMGLVASLLMFAAALPGLIIIIGGALAIELLSELAGVSIVVFGGLVLFIPFVYLNTAWMFASLLCIDRKIDFWPAMSLSMRAVNKHWLSCFLFGLLISLLNLAGALAICIGVFFTIPWSMMALACFYEDVFGRQRVNQLEAEVE